MTYSLDWAEWLKACPDADLTMTYYRWPYNLATTPPELWAHLVHDSVWEGEA